MYNRKINNHYLLIKYLTGKWTIQTTRFLFINKTILENKSSDNFNNNKKFIFSNKNHCDLHLIIKNDICQSKQQIKKIYFNYIYKEKNNKVFFQLKNIASNLFKVTKCNLNLFVRQHEYFYIVNMNIIIIITIVQNLKNQYLAIKVSSCIRLK
uniref:Uncharacterized protein n=1 Tax=Tolypiocladia glomerulata TaxID=860646 RepID=A0A1Z1MVA8_9FLOR|nr:hypothetical protein [Tolypiocladia glomerulata]ARW69725.1 hypothetical protein [Tolypiocladia glomerulata]